MSLPLAGLRILDLSHVLAGPYATHFLGMLGADVIKVEKPGIGDSMRDLATQPGLQGLAPGFVAANVAKRSLAIDIAKADGRRVIERLAETADVFVENFRPGKMQSLGLGPERLRQINPRIVYCSISAWGQSGPLAGRGGYDHVMQAATGMMMLQGDRADAPPVKVGFPVIDLATGMMGALAILAAIAARRGGDSAPIELDVSMANAALFLMSPMATRYMLTGDAPQRVGNVGFAASPGASLFETADGWLSTAANTLGQFDALCRVLGRPELASAPDYLKIRPDDAGSMLRNLATPKLMSELHAAFKGRPSKDWEAALTKAGVPAAAVRSLPEFIDGAYRETGGIGMTVPDGHGGKPGETFGAGFRWNGSAVGVPKAAPKLGQNGDALLADLGYSGDQIAKLRKDGVIG
ncbi:MAG TPA: CoA transferase [Candidatus Cybelea sp.]|nr:CoA transferase [Candidatus Cybelea sp.]